MSVNHCAQSPVKIRKIFKLISYSVISFIYQSRLQSVKHNVQLKASELFCCNQWPYEYFGGSSLRGDSSCQVVSAPLFLGNLLLVIIAGQCLNIQGYDMGLAFSCREKGIVSRFLPFFECCKFFYPSIVLHTKKKKKAFEKQIAMYKLTRMNFDATYMNACMCKTVYLECILIIQLKMSVGLRTSKIITTTPQCFITEAVLISVLKSMDQIRHFQNLLVLGYLCLYWSILN